MSFNTEKYSRSITLACPTCASTQFEYDEEETSGEAPMKCAGCERVLTRDELKEANAENIEEHLNEVKKQVTQDLQKHLHDTLKNAFRGNKNFRIK
ncbi:MULTISPECIES: hypothetical protein [Stenotrophomonas]|uniref:ECs_2282 family putative zinc-binding protein n=1 Tax=Stenotrophomonas TaxID=40323 RepID=UPI000A4E6D12|nr:MULTISPECIES: hypothetical protein [Stenotrophomonas]